MPTIDASNVATVAGSGTSWSTSWVAVRDAATGSAIDASSDGSDMGHYRFYARGAYFFYIYRVFAAFDTSAADLGIAPSEATLQVYGRTSSSATAADFFIVKGTQGAGDPARADWDAIAGWDTSTGADGSGAGDQESNITTANGFYSAEWVTGTTAWNESGYNDITLNATARADMASGDALYICMIESVHDLRDDNSTGSPINGLYFDDDLGKVMRIDYTAGVAASATDNAVFFGTNF